MKLVSKLNPVITQGTRKKEEEFAYNKDAGMFVCKAGHVAIQKKVKTPGKSKKNKRYTYFFDVQKCQTCPFQEGCYTEGAKTKSYSVTIKSEEHKEQELFQESV